MKLLHQFISGNIQFLIKRKNIIFERSLILIRVTLPGLQMNLNESRRQNLMKLKNKTSHKIAGYWVKEKK